MKAKFKIELVLSVFFTFAIVIIAPIILAHISNQTGKMIIRPLAYVLLLGIPFILCKGLKNPIGTLGFKKENITKQVLMGVCVFVMLDLVITIAVFALGDNKGILLPAKENRIGIIIYSVIFNMIFVGMGEETLFRGYFMERFRTLTNSDIWAVVISALMFGIWHFPNGQDFLQVILTALIGAVFGLARLKMKNATTLSVGISHGLHNVYILLLSSFLL
jgi:membrane protease YdiL (CAAX protease family)